MDGLGILLLDKNVWNEKSGMGGGFDESLFRCPTFLSLLFNIFHEPDGHSGHPARLRHS